MGEPNGPPQSSPEVQELFFDLIARVASANAAESGAPPMTIQWDFSDADPWYIHVANGSTAAHSGRAPKADLTLRTSWADWIAVSVRGEDPRRMVLRRRIRPRTCRRRPSAAPTPDRW